jgi:hypothetical protein
LGDFENLKLQKNKMGVIYYGRGAILSPETDYFNGGYQINAQNLGFYTYNEKVHSIHKGLKKEAFLELFTHNLIRWEPNSTPKYV